MFVEPPGKKHIIGMRLSTTEKAALLLWGLCSRLLLPLVLLRYWLLGLRESGYRQRLGERLGLVRHLDLANVRQVGVQRAGTKNEAMPAAGLIWVHAVSLGEVRAVSPLVEGLLTDGGEGAAQVLFTCTTSTGSLAIRQRFADRILHCYMPWDTPGAVERLLRTLRPRLLMLVEAELWPTLLDRCRRHRIPVVLANARMSSRSARRYHRMEALMGPVFRTLQCALARTDEDVQRLTALGVAAEKVQRTGDLKYSAGDAEVLQAQARLLGDELQLGYRQHIWLAGSTHEGEEEQVLEAAKAVLEQLPQALLILAPRHPRRFDQVSELVQQAGLSCRRRSQGESARQGQVFLLDSIGELSACYALAQVAFVGGSLVPVGGHNLLEPAVQQRPVLAGPHRENFAEVADRLSSAGGLQTVGNAKSMARAVTELLRSPEKAKSMGLKAAKGIGRWQGKGGSGSQSLQHHLQAVRRILQAEGAQAEVEESD